MPCEETAPAPTLSIIVPAYNEAANISTALERVKRCGYDCPIIVVDDGKADVVYGSRFAGGGAHRVLFFWHMLGNSLLTFFSNTLTNLNLTGMETGYKAFTKEVAKRLVIRENRFGFKPEFTARVARMNLRIYEVGVSYSGRKYAQGKKVCWKDGVSALRCIIKYNLFDRL